MSMWEFEALGEMSVEMVNKTDLPLTEKRDLYNAIFDLITQFDVSYTLFRNAQALVDGRFLHRIDMTAHPDYEARKDEFAAIVEAGKSTWIKPMGFVEGEQTSYVPAEALYDPRAFNDPVPGLWFDCSMAFWKRVSDEGILTGLAAAPITQMSTRDTILRLMKLAANATPPEESILKMLHAMVEYSLMHSEDPPKVGDADFAAILDIPQLKSALNAKHDDWVDERFDTRYGLNYAEGEHKKFLEWWSAPYPTLTPPASR